MYSCCWSKDINSMLLHNISFKCSAFLGSIKRAHFWPPKRYPKKGLFFIALKNPAASYSSLVMIMFLYNQNCKHNLWVISSLSYSNADPVAVCGNPMGSGLGCTSCMIWSHADSHVSMLEMYAPHLTHERSACLYSSCCSHRFCGIMFMSWYLCGVCDTAACHMRVCCCHNSAHERSRVWSHLRSTSVEIFHSVLLVLVCAAHCDQVAVLKSFCVWGTHVCMTAS